MTIKLAGASLLAAVTTLLTPAHAGRGSSIQSARAPVIVELRDVTVEQVLDADARRGDRLRQRIVTRVRGAAGTSSDGLVAIRLPDDVLRFDQLRADARRRVHAARGGDVDTARWYGERVAGLLGDIMDDVRADHGGVRLAVFDLPMTVDTTGAVVAAPGFDRLLADVDGFVTSHAFIVTGGVTSEAQQVRRVMAGLAQTADGRPIQFQTNGEWRETTNLSNPVQIHMMGGAPRAATPNSSPDVLDAGPAGTVSNAPATPLPTPTPPPSPFQAGPNPLDDLLDPDAPRDDEHAAPTGGPAASPDVDVPAIDDEPESNVLVPTISHSIFLSDDSQGAVTADTCEQLGVAELPMSVNGLDWDFNGQMSENDALHFMSWIEQNVPEDYTGPVCIDYEAPWWHFLSKKHLNLYMMTYIMGKYHEGLEFAQAARPNAQWGYWGLPQMLHVSPHWDDELPLLVPLLEASGAVYPGAYDCMPGNDDVNMYRNYAINAMATVQGTRPVYLYVNTRYCGFDDYTAWVPIEELVANAHAMFEAEWVDADGTIHRPAGIVLWDKYYYPNDIESWSALDEHHAAALTALHAVAQQHAETTYLQTEPAAE